MRRINFAIIIACALLAALPVRGQQVNQGPPRHALLGLKPSSKDSQTGPILDQTAWDLVVYGPDQIKAFADELCKRIRWDIDISNEMDAGTRPKDAALDKAVVEEFEVFTDFMLRLGLIAEEHTNVRMKRNDRGEWAYSLTPAPEFETKPWTEHASRIKKKDNVKAYAVCMVNGDYFFCERPLGGSFVPVVLDDDELSVARNAFSLIRNIGLIYQQGALDLLKEVYKRDADRFERPFQECRLYLDALSRAFANNDKIEVQYQPMPKAGALNASYKSKVLPLEKAITDAVVDCVVTSDSWEIQRDAAGNILRRVIYGYSFVQTKRGKQATRVSWAEDYQGGGKYGAVHSYGVGGGQFYVK